MKNKSRILVSLITIMLCFTIFSTVAFAGGGEEEVSLIPEETEKTKTDAVPLTPDGNLTLVDDVSGEEAEDKQFVTVVSKNGNYFYLVIDRAGDRQNVYFLNLVDEEDLLALIEEDKPKQQETPQRCNCINLDRKSTRLNSSHVKISYAVFCLKKKKKKMKKHNIK